MISFFAPLVLFVFLSGAEGQQFDKRNVVFSNGSRLTVEVAQTDMQRSQGLMNRTSLPQGQGMLFIFPQEQVLSFWMKNTLLPLSIGFFNKKKTLLEIQDMEPSVGPVRDENLPRYVSRDPTMYAIEVPRGWFAAKKIKPGATFSFQK